jgi:hypothetical protein
VKLDDVPEPAECDNPLRDYRDSPLDPFDNNRRQIILLLSSFREFNNRSV